MFIRALYMANEQHHKQTGKPSESYRYRCRFLCPVKEQRGGGCGSLILGPTRVCLSPWHILEQRQAVLVCQYPQGATPAAGDHQSTAVFLPHRLFPRNISRTETELLGQVYATQQFFLCRGNSPLADKLYSLSLCAATAVPRHQSRAETLAIDQHL